MELGRRGRKRCLGIEDEDWHLILAGVGTVEARKQVGIGRKTGYRWRAERGGLPPLRRLEGDRSDRYLTLLAPANRDFASPRSVDPGNRSETRGERRRRSVGTGPQ